ncbi:apurinic/apyrimidinic endonuclease Apn1, putative [Plasmodium knowlesi strain H]|uniref:Apurinic/apyrimidinic endonuclease Apn1, putative n=3 Tax=Plasmodium knowlesi TaxID=5850 RepID=A0A5K1TZL2_PLAKH|nr:DNA-(apurinic or apyrimidinic site) lyase 1, putative [Plasmodium knowlesi strain H]OTN66477.1 putative Apurinic/apyrimidinic endonuclease Apn1 [Plasmodium knowlesi]CAA9989998.1 DNA-(apurinic or apyrimidinic site) lyase 1, putative [Plasmodium knowlesi strain H]SBO24594.1 apurinic/apyrimidinic endonuclease Apn1, putative [Plasmodium knowlesi strain H]SBO26259.1 apurinic/apyrimidinic endonuclease Apn1, putative [Plasmodium knowlesi strain H]VVS79472.1 DNA-(apurinic or apyrimidinic site) lyas|eukprot:XP_002260013.1 apurinic/apyrimidinic endonuclease Apn1,putative [Plasmodium knowlesi strain H]
MFFFLFSSLLCMVLANTLRGVKNTHDAFNRLGFITPWGKVNLEKFSRSGANRGVGNILETLGSPLHRRSLFHLNIEKRKGTPFAKPYQVSAVQRSENIPPPIKCIKEEASDEMIGTKGETKLKQEKKEEVSVSKKKINKKEEKKKGTQIKGEKRHVKEKVASIYPPIPKSMDERWNDFNIIQSYRKITNVYLGAHISAAGGVQNSPTNCFNVAGQAFALFLKNQRKWDSPPLSSENIKQFEKNCKAYNLDTRFILPHGSYLINLANPDKEKREKSYLSFLDDVKRCEQLKVQLYNFHPGSTTGLCSLEEGIKNISDCINRVHKETSNVIIVLENSAGQKNSVGSKFEDLKNIISQIEDKSRIGVCLDTCHTFAAGYDIRSYEDFDLVMKKFDEIVDAKYLKAIHLNDSKSDLGSGLDRHENIGKGKLTMDTFKYIMTSKYFKNIPIILETPDVTDDESVYKYEIRYLYEMVVKAEGENN